METSGVENCLFSFVLIIDSTEGMNSFFEKLTFAGTYKKRTQWIILDRRISSEVQETCGVEFFKNIKKLNGSPVEYRRVPSDSTVAECYNMSLKLIKGRFVNFTNEHIMYDGPVLGRVLKAAKKYPKESLFSANRKLLKTDLNQKPFNSLAGLSYFTKREKLNENWFIRTFFHSYFFKTDFICKSLFSDVCDEESGTIFLINALERAGSIVYLRGAYCYYDEYLHFRSSDYYGCDNKDFYIKSLELNYKPITDRYNKNNKKIPKWLQKVIYYQIYFKYYSNLNLRNHYLLNSAEADRFFELTGEILKNVDDEFIMDNIGYQQFSPPFSLRNLFMYLKNDSDISRLDRRFMIENGNLYYLQCGCKYDLSRHQDLKVMAFNVKDGYLIMDMRFFTNILYDFSPNAIYAKLDGERYDCIHTGLYALDKVFGVSIEKSYTFLVKFPLEKLKKAGAEISFYLELNDERIKLPLFFSRAPSKINNNCPHSFWRFDDSYALEYSDGSLRTLNMSDSQAQLRDREFVKEAVSYLKKRKSKNKMAAQINRENIHLIKKLRSTYYLSKPEFQGRRIWIYFDKLFKAGDNGEYLFRYAVSREKEDGIENYYVVNEDCPDYPRLKEEFGDRILIFGSFKCRLYGLMAENIVATHPDIIEFLGFDSKLTPYFKDLFNPGLICIAHGITIQKNAEYQNRVFDNTMFYTTSSKYEVNHIMRPIYGYDKDEVALTGMARFDGLKNDDKKQILITPTWRRNIVGSAKRNTTREYSEAFKSTEYFRIYNSLINDQRIIDTARKTGYRIIFLLHPSMSTQIDDYDRNDYVELLQASGDMSYEKILTRSSLMITDYSGIHYDFGYMRKPVIYYQPKEVPMRFEEGAMKFASMGFGPVCTEYDNAVELICEYMENKCKMPDEYKKRADDFFAFDDFNNCERIYRAIYNWTNIGKK